MAVSCTNKHTHEHFSSALSFADCLEAFTGQNTFALSFSSFLYSCRFFPSTKERRERKKREQLRWKEKRGGWEQTKHKQGSEFFLAKNNITKTLCLKRLKKLCRSEEKTTKILEEEEKERKWEGVCVLYRRKMLPKLIFLTLTFKSFKSNSNSV